MGVVEGDANLVSHGLKYGDGGGIKGVGLVALDGEGTDDPTAGTEGNGSLGAGEGEEWVSQAGIIQLGAQSDAATLIGNTPADHANADLDAVLTGKHCLAGLAGASAQESIFARIIEEEESDIVELEAITDEINHLADEGIGVEQGGGGLADLSGGLEVGGALSEDGSTRVYLSFEILQAEAKPGGHGIEGAGEGADLILSCRGE